MAEELLTRLFNTILESERMTVDNKSADILDFKNKGNAKSFSNYKGTKTISHSIKMGKNNGSDG